MSKLNKYANLYDKDGNLLRHVNAQGILEDYTIEEVEELVDKLAEDKDENGNYNHPQALNNAMYILMSLYQRYGNPHAEELLTKLKSAVKKTEDDQVIEALKEVEKEVEGEDNNSIPEEQENIVETPENELVTEGDMPENYYAVEEDLTYNLPNKNDGEYVEFEEL